MSTFKKGLLSGGKTAWSLSKVMCPITDLVTRLQFPPILPWLLELIEP